MDWLVSDALYTQEHLLDFLINVMYKASFLGYTQEKLDEEVEKLEENIRQSKAGQTYPIEELLEDFEFETEEKVDE